MHDSSIHENSTVGVAVEGAGQIDATGNWWGSAAGPFHYASNPTGTGNPVSNGVLFAPFLTEDPLLAPPPPATCTPGTTNCYDNVMFIPGIEGSRLYDGDTTVWLPADDNAAETLRMNPDGTSIKQSITSFDALDEADAPQLGHNVYKNLLADMRTWETVYGITATTTPYDWRLDFDTLLSNGRVLSNGHISYLVPPAPGADAYFVATLRHLATTSKTGKVTIVAHSMGGLVAKAMMQKLGDAETARLIDKVILVDSPQLGTPKAIGTLLHGYDAGIIGAISPAKARDLAQNMPSAYLLLPSDDYFSYRDNATGQMATNTQEVVLSFDQNSLFSWNSVYGPAIHSVAGMSQFMTDETHRSTAVIANVAAPQVVNGTLLGHASMAHSTLDSWTPPDGVKLYLIGGWGNETISGIHYERVPYLDCVVQASTAGFLASRDCNLETNISYVPETVIDGDGTVVESSEMWANGATSTRYWVNLNKYNEVLGVSLPGFLRTTHADILEIDQLRTLISETLFAPSVTLPSYVLSSRPESTTIVPRLHFILHSPLTLGFLDQNGNYTGSTATSSVFNIPGVDYERFGEVQWLSVPKGLAGKVVMHGVASGSFALDVEEVNGNSITATTTFAAIPSSTSTVVTLPVDASSSPAASSTLSVDYDGNGIPDASYHAKLDSMVLPDITPPTTTLSLTGITGRYGWYTSNVQVILNATDTESGVQATYVSLDGAATTTATTTTIKTEGIHTLTFFSVDNAGNPETPTSTIIKIDKTAPEATIGFVTSTKRITATGSDNLSSTTISTFATSSIITDDPGHTLTLKLARTVQQTNYAAWTISSLSYDTDSTTNATTTLRYWWSTNASGAYTLFISAISTPTSRVLAVYVPLLNKTYSVTTSASDDSLDLSTLVARLILRKQIRTYNRVYIPSLSTNKGTLIIN